MTYNTKAAVVKCIPKYLDKFQDDIDYLNDIDSRLNIYINRVLNSPNEHGKYEILAVFRFLDFVDKYAFNVSKFKKFVKFYENLRFPSERGQMSFKLTPVQVFQFANILGFIKDNGYRLCRKALLYVPRKFSKTTSVAALAIWDLLFGPPDAQAYVASNAFKQADICFQIISNTLKPLDPKMQSFRRNRDKIYSKLPGKTSFIQCLSSSPETLDGLNASTIILDEYAASPSAALKNVLTSSQGIRKEPLLITITTASTNLDGPFIMIDLPNYKKILEGIIEDDTVFCSIFEPDEGDDFGSPATWRKVQPHLGITVTEDFYERSWADACTSVDDMTEFRTKLLNVNTQPVDKEWVKRKVIEKATTHINLKDLTSRPYCMIGVDLSVKGDFSCVTYGLYDTVTKKMVFYTDYYIPKESLYEHSNSELYLRWADQGYLKICGQEVIDYEMIAKDIIENAKYVNIQGIGYDAYRNIEFTNYLKAAGVKCLKPYRQTLAAFTTPVESFEQKIYDGTMFIDDNPINLWCIENVALEYDNMKNCKPIKKSANKKIDSCITTLMAIGQFITWKRV